MAFDFTWDATFNTPVAPPDPDAWIPTVWAKEDGTGVGPAIALTDIASAGSIPGVSFNATTVSIDSGANNTTISGIDFGTRAIQPNGVSNLTIEDCQVNTHSSSNGGHNFRIGISTPCSNVTVRRMRFINTGRINASMIHGYHTTGSFTIEDCDFVEPAGQDPIKGPEWDQVCVLTIQGNRIKGFYLLGSDHIDFIDFRGSRSGSSVRRNILIASIVAGSQAPSQPGQNMNNLGRYINGESQTSVASGISIEENIFVGSDGGPPSQFMFQCFGTTNGGNRFYNNLYDPRGSSLWYSAGQKCADWYARIFDYAASVTAGSVQNIGSPVSWPLLPSDPAAVPQDMEAPVLTGGAGKVVWAEVARPWNNRSLIDRYDLQWSTDGTNWITVSNVLRTASEYTGLTAGGGYRIRMRAHNAIGNASNWSPASNVVTVT